MKEFFGLLVAAFKEWGADQASRLSAALAYYAVFSLAPLLVLAVSIAGLVFGEEAANGEVANQLSGLMGDQAAVTVQSALAATGDRRSDGIWGMIVGTGVLLFGASTVFGELKNALNTIWGVAPRPGRAVATLVRDRLLSFSLVFGIGFVLLVSLVISSLIAGLGSMIASRFAMAPWVWGAVDFALSVGLTGVLFAAVFRILPDVRLHWSDVWSGAFFTGVLFTIGKSGIAWYLGRNSVASSFGAAGALVVILLWVYYASCILFLGAEFTKVRHLRKRGPIKPEPHAVRIASAQSAFEKTNAET